MSSRSGSATPENNQPLSVPPSPYLNLEIYLECHQKAIEQVCFAFIKLEISLYLSSIYIF